MATKKINEKGQEMGFIDKVEKPQLVIKIQFGVFFKNSFNKSKLVDEKKKGLDDVHQSTK